MYETKKKRRVRIDMWTKEAHIEDQKAQEEHNSKIQTKEFKFPHEKGSGFRTRYGWFAGYGMDIIETDNQVASYTVAIVENDWNGVELIPVTCIIFVP